MFPTFSPKVDQLELMSFVIGQC